MSLLSVEGLTVTLSGKPVLTDVTISIEPGEIVTVVGPNGSGKSTLLRAILGAVPLASGNIRHSKGLRIGYVPQKLHLDPSLPISVSRFLNMPKRRSKKDIADALLEADVPALHNAQVSDLSGGQLQRVLLARALLDKPQLLMLDEATQGLDQSGSAAFYRKIEEVRSHLNCAVLMISHELHVVMSASDRVICLNGHVCCNGTPDVVASAPAYRALFGSGTGGALAIYRHSHDHTHDHSNGGAA